LVGLSWILISFWDHPQKKHISSFYGEQRPNFFWEENPAAFRELGCDVSKERFRDSRSYSALAQTAIPSPKNDSEITASQKKPLKNRQTKKPEKEFSSSNDPFFRCELLVSRIGVYFWVVNRTVICLQFYSSSCLGSKTNRLQVP